MKPPAVPAPGAGKKGPEPPRLAAPGRVFVTQVRRDPPLKVPVLQQPKWRVAVRPAVGAFALHPDGKHFLYGDFGGVLHLAELATGKTVRELKGHTGWVLALAVSADGTRALSGSADRTARLWDLTTGAVLQAFNRHADHVRVVRLSADGKRALSLDCPWGKGPGAAYLWDTATGEVLASVPGKEKSAVHGALFYPDDRRVLLSRGTFGQKPDLTLWDPVTGQERPYLVPKPDMNPEPIGRIVLSGDGERLVYYCKHALSLVRTRGARVLGEVDLETYTSSGLDLRADAQYCLCVGGASEARRLLDCFIHVISCKTGREVCRMSWPTAAFDNALFTPDGRHVLSSAHNELLLWELPKLE
jgi:WD40 repeat protein